MSVFVLETVFWKSAAVALLRTLSLSSRRPYRVMVVIAPFWLRDVETGAREAMGAFATRVVIASSEPEAKELAIAAVRRGMGIIADPKQPAPKIEVEQLSVLKGVVWRQGRGFSLFKE